MLANSLIALVVLVVGGVATPTMSDGLPSATSAVHSLNKLARSRGKLYFGSATHNPELPDTPYVDILTGGMFGQMTDGKSMKWAPTEPEQDVYNYTDGDVIAKLAKGSKMILRGHNLCWDSEVPTWLTAGSFNKSSLVSILTSHVTSEVTHYKGQIYAWDVVNEPFGDQGGMREWFYQDNVGTSYINAAFHAAHAADPGAKLYINDYNLEFTGAKIDTAVSAVASLLQEGVPIHGIGFEGHMNVGEVPSAAAIAANMERFTALGLEVALTEIDIRMKLPASGPLLEQQKADYQTMIIACMMVEKCVGMTLWDFTDKYSWIVATYPGAGEACPWDSDLKQKPAFDGIVAGLNFRR